MRIQILKMARISAYLWPSWGLSMLLLHDISAVGAQVAQRGTMQIKEGQVVYQRLQTPPVTAGVPQPLDFGDQLQTAELSWAIVNFIDVSRSEERRVGKECRSRW